MRYDRLVMIVGAAFTLLSCAELTSVREPVAISVSASELNLLLDEVKVLGAWLVDDEGRTVSGSPEWSSSDPGIATIEKQQGVVTAIGLGTATMTATFGALRATTFVTVRAPNPPNTLSISLAPAAVIAGGSDSLAAEAYDAKGRFTRVAITWSSADATVATIDAYGIVVGVGAGTTTVTATAGALSATVTMSVIALTNSLSFMRRTPMGGNPYTSDVLSFSAADRLIEPVARSVQSASVAAPAWSTDGSSLAVDVIHAFHYDASHFWEDYNSDLYILDGAATWRALTTDNLSKSPSWSPDGKRVAYLRQKSLFADNNIFVIDVGAGTSVRVTSTDGWYGSPIWSPDGTRLAFSRYEVSSNYLLSINEVFIVNADGSGLTNVSQNSAQDFNPIWSPDGNQLAFVSSRGRTVNAPYDGVYIMDVDGRNARRLITRQDLAEIAWSPNGQQIAFSAGGSLYVMNADGSSPARLTRPPSNLWDRNPAWRR